jgi:PKD repeat protein
MEDEVWYDLYDLDNSANFCVKVLAQVDTLMRTSARIGPAPHTTSMWVDWPGITLAQAVWDYGDGQSEIALTPTHEFTDPGTYNVRVEITTDEDSSLACTETQWIYVTADTADMELAEVTPEGSVCINVVARNQVPLSRLVVPFSWSEFPDYTLDSLTFAGTRVEGYLELFQMSYVDAWKAATFMLETYDNNRLPPGAGTVAKIYLSQPFPTPLEESPVNLWEYLDYGVDFYTYAGKYQPVLGTHVQTGCCVTRVGDVNQSGEDEPTIGDVSMLIDALFITSDVEILGCLAEADINQSGGVIPEAADITIGDVSMLIDYLFITGESLGLPGCAGVYQTVPAWIRDVLSSSKSSDSDVGFDNPGDVLEEYIRRIGF